METEFYEKQSRIHVNTFSTSLDLKCYIFIKFFTNYLLKKSYHDSWEAAFEYKFVTFHISEIRKHEL